MAIIQHEKSIRLGGCVPDMSLTAAYAHVVLMDHPVNATRMSCQGSVYATEAR